MSITKHLILLKNILATYEIENRKIFRADLYHVSNLKMKNKWTLGTKESPCFWCQGFHPFKELLGSLLHDSSFAIRLLLMNSFLYQESFLCLFVKNGFCISFLFPCNQGNAKLMSTNNNIINYHDKIIYILILEIQNTCFKGILCRSKVWASIH